MRGDGRIQSAYGALCKTMYAICAYQRSHLTPCLPTRPESCLGREPPEMATVKRAFFSMASFCAFMTKTARASISSEVLAKEKRGPHRRDIWDPTFLQPDDGQAPVAIGEPHPEHSPRLLPATGRATVTQRAWSRHGRRPEGARGRLEML